MNAFAHRLVQILSVEIAHVASSRRLLAPPSLELQRQDGSTVSEEENRFLRRLSLAELVAADANNDGVVSQGELESYMDNVTNETLSWQGKFTAGIANDLNQTIEPEIGFACVDNIIIIPESSESRRQLAQQNLGNVSSEASSSNASYRFGVSAGIDLGVVLNVSNMSNASCVHVLPLAAAATTATAVTTLMATMVAATTVAPAVDTAASTAIMVTTTSTTATGATWTTSNVNVSHKSAEQHDGMTASATSTTISVQITLNASTNVSQNSSTSNSSILLETLHVPSQKRDPEISKENGGAIMPLIVILVLVVFIALIAAIVKHPKESRRALAAMSRALQSIKQRMGRSRSVGSQDEKQSATHDGVAEVVGRHPRVKGQGGRKNSHKGWQFQLSTALAPMSRILQRTRREKVRGATARQCPLGKTSHVDASSTRQFTDPVPDPQSSGKEARGKAATPPEDQSGPQMNHDQSRPTETLPQSNWTTSCRTPHNCRISVPRRGAPWIGGIFVVNPRSDPATEANCVPSLSTPSIPSTPPPPPCDKVNSPAAPAQALDLNDVKLNQEFSRECDSCADSSNPNCSVPSVTPTAGSRRRADPDAGKSEMTNMEIMTEAQGVASSAHTTNLQLDRPSTNDGASTSGYTKEAEGAGSQKAEDAMPSTAFATEFNGSDPPENELMSLDVDGELDVAIKGHNQVVDTPFSTQFATEYVQQEGENAHGESCQNANCTSTSDVRGDV